MAVYIYKNSIKYPLLGAKVYQNNSVYTLNAHNKFYARKYSFTYDYDIADWILWFPDTTSSRAYFKAPNDTMLSVYTDGDQEFNHASSSTEWVLMGCGYYRVKYIRGTAIKKITSLKLTGDIPHNNIDFTKFQSLYFLDMSDCARYSTFGSFAVEDIIDQLVSVNIQTSEEKYLNLGTITNYTAYLSDAYDIQTKTNELIELGWTVDFVINDLGQNPVVAT